MKTVDLLVKEHENIKRMLKVVRQLAIDVMNGAEVSYNDFELAIDFIRNYADDHHHNKEEEVFFDKIAEELGEPMASGPVQAMFSEHDLARLFIKNLEEALADVKAGDKERRVDVIANAVAYTDLLDRHIDKEDDTIYPYGEKNLAEESLAEVEAEMEQLEQKGTAAGVQDKYLEILDRLETKVF